jgi:hypothetical protein
MSEERLQGLLIVVASQVFWRPEQRVTIASLTEVMDFKKSCSRERNFLLFYLSNLKKF